MPNSVYVLEKEAFRGCKKLTKITFSNIIKTFPEGMCKGCSALTEINIPDSVTTISSVAFEKCNSLTKVIIPRTVTSIKGSAFSSCKNLSEVVILDGNIVKDDTLVAENTISISNAAFGSCENLMKVIVPRTVSEIAKGAFRGSHPDCMFYGYVPSDFATNCANSHYYFTEIVENDEIDKLIRVPYSKVSEELQEQKK
jgi:hypothetical protein